MALLLTIVVVGVATAGTLLMQAHRTRTQNEFAQQGQAVQIARSGLTEALSWMRRQTSQPVLTFEPVLDTLANPPVLDTIEPDIGIVREFKVTGTTWARYEVWKQWDTDPDTQRLILRQQWQCEDVSAARQAAGAGAAWRLRCMGYIYERRDPTAAFDEQPNRVLAKELLEAEAQRLMLQLPGQAALNVRLGGSASIGSNGRVRGGTTGAGIYYLSGAGAPGGGGSITGSPALASTTTYDDSYMGVFGTTLQDLKSMSTLVVTNMTNFPTPMPSNSLIVVENAAIHFDATHPLSGSGIVICVGNTFVDTGSNSSFSGLLYVNGNFSMRQPSEINGAVLVTGTTTLLGGSGDYATIQYDDGILNTLRQSFGNYTLSSTFKRALHEDQ
ncbi:MAG: hypothetical protein U1E73_13925 [Planctomycetota bacterium]